MLQALRKGRQFLGQGLMKDLTPSSDILLGSLSNYFNLLMASVLSTVKY